MNSQIIHNLLTARPFMPFRITMSSGQTFDVKHPEMAWLTKSLVFIGTGAFIPANEADEFRMCSLLHVTAVEPLSAVAV